MRVTQKPYEDLNVYVRRFRELSVDLQDPVSEDNLTKMCVEGMQPAFKLHLVTHNFSDFSALYEAARSLSETVDPPVRERPPQPPRYQSSSWKPIPRRADRESKRAVYAASGPSHRSRQEQFKRPKFNEPPPLPVTPVEAQAFLNAWVQDGKVVLPNVIREPSQRDMGHPDYCIFHRMVRHSTKECWGLRALFQKFVTDNSVELPACKDVLRNPLPAHKDNGKAVMMATHGRWQPSRGDSAMMISHHDELEEVAACDIATLSIEEPDKASFEDRRARTLQHSTKFKWLFDQFGLGEETRFEATKAILRVAEEHGEQCMGLLVTIIGSQKPFKPDESHMADAIFYDDVNEDESPVPPRGIPIPKWSDISKDDCPSTSGGSNKKRIRDDTGVASLDTKPLRVTKYVRPDGKEVYRL
ncbi:hypothetical protein Vadar_031458 [Vaccinium darrowii]|uniref:Uncharacterized protein n=1 Tax=Vaccinium darrowii TaxID=229202 RepID=A0ACB7YS56_9ERIC|nr:hypothetical protein Vadar_031458 [Vaccinium darrowii]